MGKMRPIFAKLLAENQIPILRKIKESANYAIMPAPYATDPSLTSAPSVQLATILIPTIADMPFAK